MAKLGGVRLTYRMVLKAGDASHLDTIRAGVRRVLERRVSGLPDSPTATVVQKGPDQFVVEITGKVDPAKADHWIAGCHLLGMYWAKTVSTTIVKRRYVSRESAAGAKPAVTFYDQMTDRLIPPGTAEYAHVIRSWRPVLDGDDLERADVMQQPNGGIVPELAFSQSGALKMEKWCRKYVDRGESLATVVDGVVISIAPLENGAIIRDKAVIEGTFDRKYVMDLVDLLNSGVLPVKLQLISSETVKPR